MRSRSLLSDDRGRLPVLVRRSARLLQAYELDFWQVASDPPGSPLPVVLPPCTVNRTDLSLNERRVHGLIPQRRARARVLGQPRRHAYTRAHAARCEPPTATIRVPRSRRLVIAMLAAVVIALGVWTVQNAASRVRGSTCSRRAKD